MTTTTLAKTRAKTRTENKMLPIATVFMAGIMLLFVSGIAQATILHDSAHDQRHAMAFPCH